MNFVNNEESCTKKKEKKIVTAILPIIYIVVIFCHYFLYLITCRLNLEQIHALKPKVCVIKKCALKRSFVQINKNCRKLSTEVKLLEQCDIHT